MSGKNKTKHNTRKTLLKGKSKKDLKELVVPLVKTPPTGGVVPPFTVFLHMRRNVMIVTVPLPRVPDKIVNYDASAERFLLDTTKFTRKPFYLEFTYPKGIKIEAGGEAKIENGIFSATLPLLSVPESFQLKPDGMDVSATNESRKRKRSAEAAQQPKTAESPAKKTTAKAKAKAGENGETAAVAPKTKQPKKKQKKAASGESSEKQIDARAVSLDKAMGLIDELGAKEESQISEKLHKEKEKKAALNVKQREKRQKKQQKKDKIEQLVDELKKEKKEQEEEKKPLKKATPRKVSFGEPGKKAAKAGGATTSPKAAKKPALKKTATKKN